MSMSSSVAGVFTYYLTSNSLCAMVGPLGDDQHHQASGGGQTTFKRYSRRTRLPNLTKPYHILCSACETTWCFWFGRKLIARPLPCVTKLYHLLPTSYDKTIMLQVSDCLESTQLGYYVPDRTTLISLHTPKEAYGGSYAIERW